MSKRAILLAVGLGAGFLAYKLMKPTGKAGTGATGAPQTPNSSQGLFSGLSSFFSTATTKGGTYPFNAQKTKVAPQTQTQPWYNNGAKAVSAPQPQPSGLVGLAQQVSAGASIVNSLSDVWGNVNPFQSSDENADPTGMNTLGSADEVQPQVPDPATPSVDFVGPPAPDNSYSVDDSLGADTSQDTAA